MLHPKHAFYQWITLLSLPDEYIVIVEHNLPPFQMFFYM